MSTTLRIPLFSLALVPWFALAAVDLGSGQTNLFTLDGRAPRDAFGRYVVALDDSDGDGVREFAVASPEDSTLGALRGNVAVFSGATRQLLYRIDGVGTNDRFGTRLATVDDVDGDGLTDLLVTAGFPPQAPVPIGRVEVRSGASGALLYTLNASSAGANTFTFGETIGGMGDIDGDGRGDLFVLATGSSSGRVRFYSGATGTFLRELAGGTNFGARTASIADLNGDGVRELAVGDPSFFQFNPTTRGRVQVVSGASGAVLRTYFGDATSWTFPFALADAGDVDRDGAGDLALSVERSSAGSEVRIMSGANGTLLRLTPNREAEDDFGAALANVGDVDGDGFVDLAIGAPGDHNGLVNAGAAFVLSGADGRELFRVPGTAISQLVGTSVARAGDLDGDGLEDLLVGAPRFPFTFAPTGSVIGVGFDGVDLTFDFERDDDFTTPLENGRALGSGQRFGRIIQLSGTGPGHFGPATFDSSPTGPNAGGPDPDLLVGRGNVVILQATAQQTVPGIFDVPNDFAGGGAVTIELLQPSRVISLDLVDIDAAAAEGAVVRLLDGAGRSRRYQVAPGYTGDVTLGSGGVRTLDLQTPFRQRGVQGDAVVVEDPGFEAGTVTRVRVELTGSGAFDAVRIRPALLSIPGLRRLWRIEDPTSPGFYSWGSVLAPAGDVDGDGRDDLLVGERVGSAPFVQVRSGRDGAVLRTFTGPAGSFSDTLGELDLDGDAVPDVVVSGFAESTPSLPSSGAARAYSGATGALLWLRRGEAEERLGGRIVAMGDLDGDGRDDVALTPASSSFSPYSVRLVSGATGALLRSIPLPGTANSYGATYGRGADFDGDGKLDLVVGLPGDSTMVFEAGRVQVYSGATGSLLFERFGEAASVQLGLSVAAVDDLDGDGDAELMVGRRDTSSGATPSVTRVVSSVDYTTPLFSFEGLGTVGGDIDGDGTRDYLVSFQAVFNGQLQSVVDGRAGRGGARLFRETASFDARFSVVTDAGDADGDGFDDVAWSRTIPGNATRFAVEVHTLARPNGAAVCFGAPNSTGFRATFRAEGSFAVGANALTLVATGVPSGTPTLLLSSSAFGIFPAPAIGGVASDGDLCIAGGPVTRHGARLAVGLVASFPLDLQALPTIGAPGGVRAAFVGETRFWQAWYRDQGAPGRSNFTDALRLTFE